MRNAKHKQPENGINGCLFPPESDWRPPRDFPNLSGSRRLGIDTETRDPGLGSRLGPGFIRGDAELVGVSLSTGDKSWYFPIGHLGGANINRENLSRFLCSILAGDQGLRELIGHNLLYDIEALSLGLGVEIPRNIRHIDTQTMAALLDEEAADLSLDGLAKTEIGYKKDETLLREAAKQFGVNPKRDLWKLESKYVGPYAEQDAWLPLKIWESQKLRIAEEELDQVADLEQRLVPLLWQMRKRGVPFDEQSARRLSNEWGVLKKDIQSDIFRDYGVQLDTGMEVDKVAFVLDGEGIEYPLTPHSKRPSITKDFIESVDHPFMGKLKALREIDRLSGTFVDDLFFKHGVNGRLHCQFKPTMMEDARGGRGGTRSGRFASSNPNLQQVPGRSDLAPYIRGLFIPDTGSLWSKMDYSQQEPRIIIHWAYVSGCPGAKEMVEYVRKNPDEKVYRLIQETSGLDYRTTKDVTLGRSYLMGIKKMMQKTGLSYEKCKQVLEGFDKKHPYFYEVSCRMMKAAESRGYIKTMLGRRSRFNLWEPAQYRERDPHTNMPADGLPINATREEALELWPNQRLKRSLVHKALNRSTQGSGGDMVKMAMVKMWEDHNYVPYLTVHDEIDGPVADKEQGQLLKHIMETALPCECPILVDMDIGTSWK